MRVLLPWMAGLLIIVAILEIVAGEVETGAIGIFIACVLAVTFWARHHGKSDETG
jgi:hypothetical protein